MKMGITASESKIEGYDVTVREPDRAPEYNITRYSPNIGLFVAFNGLHYLGIEWQVTYLQKGSDIEYFLYMFDGSMEALRQDIQFDYLQFQFAIQPRLHFTNIQIYVPIGITLDHLLAKKNVGWLPGEFDSNTNGYSIGFGVLIKETICNSFILELIYSDDFSEIYNDGTVSIKNQNWQFKFGLPI
jgi:hypothetical protein